MPTRAIILHYPHFSQTARTGRLLIIHGERDRTVAAFLGDQTFVALRRLGKEVEYAKYKGEGHSPLGWSYANQVDFCDRIIAWFNAHLAKRM